MNDLSRAEETYNVEIKVVYNSGPGANATVTSNPSGGNSPQKTGNDGKATISWLKACTYTFHAVLNGESGDSISVKVPQNPRSTVTVKIGQ